MELFVTTSKIVVAAGNKSPMNSILNQILSFFAMMAYDANFTAAGELKIADYAIFLMVDKYRESVDNLLRKQLWSFFKQKAFFCSVPSTTSSSSFDPKATAEMMPDDYTGYNDGSGFYDGDGYHVSQTEDD